jgi:hypothetical protein
VVAPHESGSTLQPFGSNLGPDLLNVCVHLGAGLARHLIHFYRLEQRMRCLFETLTVYRAAGRSIAGGYCIPTYHSRSGSSRVVESYSNGYPPSSGVQFNCGLGFPNALSIVSGAIRQANRNISQCLGTPDCCYASLRLLRAHLDTVGGRTAVAA